MCVSWVPAKIVCKLNCIVNELFVCKLMAYRATPAHPRYFAVLLCTILGVRPILFSFWLKTTQRKDNA